MSNWTQRAASTAGGAIRDAGRWESVELDLVRMVTAALGLAVPFGWGLLTDHPAEGAAATIGALLVSGCGHVGSLVHRVDDLVLGTLTSAACLLAGAALAQHPGTAIVGVPIAAGVLAVIGAVRPSLAKATAMGTVALVLSSSLAESGVPIAEIVGWFLIGAAYAGALTLAGHAIAGRIRHLARHPVEARSWRADLLTWFRGAGSHTFWSFPASLTICLVIAELAAHAENKPHATWIALTVVLVAQRDRALSLSRAVQRGVGTLVGVLLGGLALVGMPDWLVIGVVALIAALRGHLKVTNYTVYAVLMTPLVLMLLGAGRPTSASLLVERAGDTALGCTIAIVVGLVIWPRVTRRLSSAASSAH